MQRYQQIETFLSYEKPEVILEVGTWNGERAVAMCNAARTKLYIGFDLFEEADSDTDSEEMNVKPHHSQEAVYRKLELNGIFGILIKGNTRKTLPEYVEDCGEDQSDFAFIDGGHSVETIQSDWENVRKLVKPGKYIIFDDYYANMPEGFDYTKYGANSVVDKLGCFKKLLPSSDQVKGGGIVHLCVVRNEK